MAKNTLYFDCFAHIGKRAGKDPLGPWKTDKLLTEMERCQIHGALVYHNLAAEMHPQLGNPLVSEACARHERLYPCWVGLPHHTGDFPEPGKLIALMEEHDVRALKLYPREFEFQVDDLTLEPLLEALEAAGILLIFDAGLPGHGNQHVTWEELRWIGEACPNLNILLHRVRWESTRQLTPLAEAFSNIHFEFSNYQGNRMIEYWIDKIGADQLLFGTEALEKSLGAARAYVDYAQISETDRQKIAGGNLARLLRVDLPAPYSRPAPTDAILERAWDGKPVEDMEIIDGHAHFLHEGHQAATRVFMNKADIGAVVERNKTLGVDITVASPWTGIWTDYEIGNQETAEGLAAFPENFIGYAVFDPNYVEDWDRELREVYGVKGMMGMKPYWPRMGIPYNDQRFQPWWEFGNEHHLFAKMHPSDNFVKEMHDLATRFPHVNFLLAHSGWSWQHARNHVALAREYPNCHCEITFTSVTNGTIEWMSEQVGSDRVIYGSDCPMRDPAPQFGWVVYADISEDDKRNILGRNMRRIIDAVQL